MHIKESRNGMSKLLFIDVDGTLVDYENHLPESAVYAVRAARENGHRVYICTGRSRAEVYDEIWNIGLDGMIGGNGSYVDYLEAVKEFPALLAGTWGGKGETALFGDLGLRDITKARAIEVLLQYLCVSREDTIAFGDAKVDIPMLEYCKTGVAMHSGGEEIRKMADYVTDDVEMDGLYKAFVHLGLMKNSR